MADSASAQGFDYDLITIGAGSGGLATSKRAASYGAKVAIVEADRVGGTCVIRGCIPKKLMVYAAELGAAVEYAAEYGWATARGAHDWERLVEKRDAAVRSLELAHEGHLERAGVGLIRGRARVVGPHEVEIDGAVKRARFVLIATGSTPVLPDVPGIEHAITSDGFFQLPHRPERVAIVGGGYIAVELASILRGLGSKVSLIVRRELPLRGFDDDLRRELDAALRAAGVDVRASTTVRRIQRDREGLRLELDGPDGDALRVDAAMVYAVGRKPVTSDLGLEAIAVELGRDGEILVDDHGVTSVPSVLAIGDVTGRVPLTPVAIQAGRVLADRLFGNKSATMSYEDVPTAVFSEPPIATVGLTEEQARRTLGDARVTVHKARFTPLLHMLTRGKVPTTVKMIVDAQTDRVVGCHMIGHDAPEIIQGMAVAMKAGATKADFDATVGIHPSSAEEFVTFP